MGRLKSFERQKAREHQRENIGVRMPVMCAAEGCSAETQMGWVGPGPFPAALFFKEGWMARSDPTDGIVRSTAPHAGRRRKTNPLDSLRRNKSSGRTHRFPDRL